MSFSPTVKCCQKCSFKSYLLLSWLTNRYYRTHTVLLTVKRPSVLFNAEKPYCSLLYNVRFSLTVLQLRYCETHLLYIS